MSTTRRTPTIQDVARFAQVSTATVSRALSSPERVSQDTRLRISEAVLATGYTLNQAARSLRQRTSKTILVALPDIRNIFFSAILDAIEREATRRGYSTLVCNRCSGPNPARQLGEYFRSHRADGLLLLDGALNLSHLLELAGEPTDVPLVVACEDIPDAPFHTVKTDNARAAASATQHLINLGHTRIGHIAGPLGNVLRDERLEGFRQAIHDAGLYVRPDWIFPGNFQMESGFAAGLDYLAGTDRPTAMFAANDEMAIGFLSALREKGLECPRDISVVGFDDLAVAVHYSPPLTTIRQPREKLGQMAAQMLIGLLEGRAVEPRRVVLRSELILRSSTARFHSPPG
ncbi:LacI family DNA-binding transcriptional regulator [uncultured Devosia sp.]|uniref:LacI family DNA-binding transcriptional regulator n=1 Tax=uncultured Devosia sp. TaxID=211434 RepID=UPI0035C98486